MANSLLDFVMSLVRDPDAAARYAADPARRIADAHLTDVTSADVSNLIPVVSESLSMAGPRCMAWTTSVPSRRAMSGRAERLPPRSTRSTTTARSPPSSTTSHVITTSPTRATPACSRRLHGLPIWSTRRHRRQFDVRVARSAAGADDFAPTGRRTGSSRSPMPGTRPGVRPLRLTHHPTRHPRGLRSRAEFLCVRPDIPEDRPASSTSPPGIP